MSKENDKEINKRGSKTVNQTRKRNSLPERIDSKFVLDLLTACIKVGFKQGYDFACEGLFLPEDWESQFAEDFRTIAEKNLKGAYSQTRYKRDLEDEERITPAAQRKRRQRAKQKE